ncbi:MAG: ABC transporter permease, partial [Bacteroidota bacterium]
ISLLLVVQHQLEQKFVQDLQNIDLVLGAKGSPLQLVLSAIYHLDTPTGNIKLAEARAIIDDPLVEEAIPLAYGDSYQDFRILGTTLDYLEKYDAELAAGRAFNQLLEVTLGADVAKQTNAQVGTVFISTHGGHQHGHVHETHPFKVVGILEKTNTVLDRLILTNIESVWHVHTHHHPTEQLVDTIQATELDFHQRHHHHEHFEQDVAADSMEVTAVLLKYKTKKAALEKSQLVNEQTSMQTVLPALEINRLFYIVGVGATTVKLITGGIMLMAGFSVFFVLYSRLRDRKYELALLRSVGYRPWHLFVLLVLEGLFLAMLGYVFGRALSRIGIYLINRQAETDFNFQFVIERVPGDVWLLVLTLFVGVVSALLPAWRAMHMDVSTILTG